MSEKSRHSDFIRLREEFPVFHYHDYDLRFNGDSLNFSYHFSIADTFHFHPSYKIPLRNFFSAENMQISKLDSLVFNIGMVEAISYWKAACCQEIHIHPPGAGESISEWWKKLYYLGLGEFFHINGIHTSQDDFVRLVFLRSAKKEKDHFAVSDGCLVPVGGGQDSAVTLSLLKKAGQFVRPFAVNPRGAMVSSIEAAGFSISDTVVFNRTLDPLLLDLNGRGFLNGHTPFSALLAFLSVLGAGLSGMKQVALSNEASANESTVADSKINHQYSKTLEFETDFRRYLNEVITGDISYFSFLRPLRELEIARIFARHPEFFHVFKSCNAGSREDKWCCHCPKCLFTWIMLHPYLGETTLTEIFGQNLFHDPANICFLEELSGIKPVKPFECVGTVDEVNEALSISVEKYGGDLPPLLKFYTSSEAYKRNQALSQINSGNPFPASDHYVPQELYSFIEKELA